MGGFMGLPHSSHCPCGSAKRSASNLTHTEGEATSKSEPPVADPEAPQAVVPTSLGNGMAEKDKKDKGPQEGQEDVAGEKPGPIGSPENEDEKGDEEASGTRSTCASARREEQDQSDPQQPTDPEPLRVRSSKAGDFIQLATGASSIWEAVEAVRHLDEQKHGMNWALILIGFFALQPFAVAIVKIWLKRSSRVAAPVADTMVSILTEVIQLIVYGYFASWAREAVEIFGLLFGVQVFLLVLMLCCEQSAPNTLPLMDWIDLLQVAFRYYELKFAFYTWFGSLWLMALHHDAPFRQFWYQAGLACISALTELQLGLRLLHMDRIDTELSKDALKQRFDDHPEEFQPSPRTSCAWTLTVLIQAVYSLVFLLAQWSAAWIYMFSDDYKRAFEYFVLASGPCFVSVLIPLTCIIYFCGSRKLALAILRALRES